MKTVPLGDIASIERKSIHPDCIPGSTRYLGLEHIERGGRIIASPSAAEAGLTSQKFEFSERHILFGKLRPNLGKVARPNFSGVCSTDILPIAPGADVDRDYLYHYLSQSSVAIYAASRASGASLPRLSPSVLTTFLIPLPAVGEQRRIAAILDQVDAIRSRRRLVLAYLDLLLPRLFSEICSRTRPASVALGEVANFYGGTILPQGAPFIDQADGFLLLRVSDMNAIGNERRLVSASQ